MRKWVVLLLVLILLLASGIIMFSAKFVSSTASIPKIGAYYYPWYTGNWERDHSNTVDTPVLGKYNSSDVNVIRQHLSWFKELKLDFLIVSWWGKDSLSDNNTKILLKEIVASNNNLELFIMVEPFDFSWLEAYDTTTRLYNYRLIYDYIYETYVLAYGVHYMKLQEHPLIAFYSGNGNNLTRNSDFQEDARFTVRITGVDKYDWELQVPSSTLSQQPLCRDGEINVMPRYDANGWQIDMTYSEGLYDQQWNKAIKFATQGMVNFVTIASWNEYAERTQIEPTNDTTSFTSSPYYLFERTRMYIDNIKSTQTTKEVPFSMTWVAAVAVSAAVVEAGLLAYFIKRKKQVTKSEK